MSRLFNGRPDYFTYYPYHLGIYTKHYQNSVQVLNYSGGPDSEENHLSYYSFYEPTEYPASSEYRLGKKHIWK